MALSALSTSAFKIGSIPLSTSVSPLFAANAPRKAGKVPDLTNTVAADLCRASAYSAGSELRQPRKDRQTAPSVMTHAKERRVRTCRCQLGTKIHRWQTREYISSGADGSGLPRSLRRISTMASAAGPYRSCSYRGRSYLHEPRRSGMGGLPPALERPYWRRHQHPVPQVSEPNAPAFQSIP